MLLQGVLCAHQTIFKCSVLRIAHVANTRCQIHKCSCCFICSLVCQSVHPSISSQSILHPNSAFIHLISLYYHGRALDLDLVVRDDEGNILNPEHASVVRIYKGVNCLLLPLTTLLCIFFSGISYTTISPYVLLCGLTHNNLTLCFTFHLTINTFHFLLRSVSCA